jgi:hypothetical protein
MWTHLNSVGCEVSPLALLEHVVGRVQPAVGLHLLQSGSLPVKKMQPMRSRTDPMKLELSNFSSRTIFKN